MAKKSRSKYPGQKCWSKDPWQNFWSDLVFTNSSSKFLEKIFFFFVLKSWSKILIKNPGQNQKTELPELNKKNPQFHYFNKKIDFL